MKRWLSLLLLAGLLSSAARSQGLAPSIRTRRTTITSAQVLALNATPIEVVPAPGASSLLVFEGAQIYKPAGTAYAGIAAGEDLAFRYTDGSGLQVGQVETIGFLDQATAQVRFVRPHTAASGVSDITPPANAKFVAHLLSGEVTTGTSALYVRVYHRTLATTLN